MGVVNGVYTSILGPPAQPKKLEKPPMTAPSRWGPASDGRWRWAINADMWRPALLAHDPEFMLLLDLLTLDESVRLQKLPWKDKKRSLLGQLLIRRACAQALAQEDFSGICLSRTHGGKPFLVKPLPPELPNFNFNVSHDGRWVVLASDPLQLVGVDVSAPQRERGEEETDNYLEDLQSLLFDSETSAIKREATVCGRYEVFQRIWSAKESLSKAVGQGVEFNFERIEVILDGGAGLPTLSSILPWRTDEEDQQKSGPSSPTAAVSVDIWPRDDFAITQEKLLFDHWTSVASIPVEEVVDRNGVFTETLRLTGISGAASSLYSRMPQPRFEILHLEDLLPEAVAEELRRQRLVDPCPGFA